MLDSNQIAAASRTLQGHWRAGTKLDNLDAAQRPQSREEGYAIQAEIERTSGAQTVRLEDRRHQRGRAEAHQCAGPDGRAHSAGDADRRRRHGVDGRQRDARRRAGICLPHAHRPAAAADGHIRSPRCSTPSTPCIPPSRFRIRALPISSKRAKRRSSPTMPARICSCWARPRPRTGARSIWSRSGRSITLRGQRSCRPRQERARRSPRGAGLARQ